MFAWIYEHSPVKKNQPLQLFSHIFLTTVESPLCSSWYLDSPCSWDGDSVRIAFLLPKAVLSGLSSLRTAVWNWWSHNLGICESLFSWFYLKEPCSFCNVPRCQDRKSFSSSPFPKISSSSYTFLFFQHSRLAAFCC